MNGGAGAAADRARIAADLRDEARVLLVETGLLELLQQKFGEATITGSAGYDLMVWRDLDIHMPCDAEQWEGWMGLSIEIARQLQSRGLTLSKAHYVNGYVEPQYLGAGFYLGIEFRDFADNAWSCNLWGWEAFDYAVRQARDANLRADLGAANRDLILRLKHEARARDGYYGAVVTSFDIYEFVVARAGNSLDELEAWKGLS